VLGFIVIFLGVICAAVTNDYFDYPTDRLNKNAGMFNGGSRVLVEGELGFNEVKRGIFVLSRKRFAVIFGTRLAAIISLYLIAVTALSGILFWYFNILTGPGSITVVLAIPYSLILSFAVIKMIKTDDYERAINRIFPLTIFNILLIGLILLVSLLWR
jgi:4-hydroxybenzoate polyprenyltransferase